MDFVNSIGDWISERESLLSGAAAIIVLVSVLVSVVGLAYRRLMKTDSGDSSDEESTAAGVITLKDLSAPSAATIEFAESDGLRIAYTLQGSGPHDIVMSPGIISHLNLMSHMPPIRNTIEDLSQFARVLSFDKRGQGLSDPCVAVPDLNERVHDIEAVMDAAGMDQAILYGISEGGPMCLKFAHDHPERVKGLVLLGTTASWMQRADFPGGIAEKALDAMATAWGTGSLRDLFFPGISRQQMDDKTYQAFENLIATRDSIRQIVEYMKMTDVRPLLPQISCPALVIHFSGDLSVPIRLGRAVADALPNAEFLEVSGIDHADLSQSPEGMERVQQFADSLQRLLPD